MKEIGSEFWLNSDVISGEDSFPEWLKFGDDQELLYSGRTAIYHVLNDLGLERKKAYFPSYCCDSMLQPFIDKKFIIEFYDVHYFDGKLFYDIDYSNNCDVFVAMSYFGFSSTSMDYAIERFSKMNTIVIEDITHRLLSRKSYSENSNYLFASLRKWVAMPTGGVAIKQKGYFQNIELKNPSIENINMKMKAMNKKFNYLNNKKTDETSSKDDKSIFMDLFSEYNKSLKNNYKNLKIDKYSRQIINSINIENIKTIRKINSKYLHERLSKFNFLKPLIKEVDFEKDCPLFYPIILEESYRDLLRSELIENNIYPPIHWPVPVEVTKQNSISNIYCRELSLICDQRYNIEELERIVQVIGGFKQKL